MYLFQAFSVQYKTIKHKFMQHRPSHVYNCSGNYQTYDNSSWPVCQWPTCKASTLPSATGNHSVEAQKCYFEIKTILAPYFSVLSFIILCVEVNRQMSSGFGQKDGSVQR